jgi:hypothetical protein
VRISDDCEARDGDVVITRRNGRSLGVSGTDWVKNGDRWIVTGIKNGVLSVRHRGSRLHATLSAAYIADHVELGYASTVHAAQGLTADVMHGIVTGEESRQTLYMMLTRGKVENHVHVVLAEDSEDHTLPNPTLDRQATVTELLEGVLVRDSAAFSATTTRGLTASPEAQLGEAVTRYADALASSATSVRVDFDSAPLGPLPWLAGVPDELAEHAAWGPYLATRARRVSALAVQVHGRAGSWSPRGSASPRPSSRSRGHPSARRTGTPGCRSVEMSAPPIRWTYDRDRITRPEAARRPYGPARGRPSWGAA